MRVAWLKDLRMADVEQVGGKNASLGEMISNLAAAGIRVPGGFATTAQAYREFLGELGPRIDERLRALNPEDVDALAKCGAEVRSWILKQAFPVALEQEIRAKYQELTRTLQAMLVRRALLGDGRGSARCVLRRPAGNVSQHPRRRQRA